jgi:hypothetical protein
VGTHTHGSFVDRTRITVAALPPCRTDEYTSLHHGGGSAGSRDGVVGRSGMGPGRAGARREAGFDSGYRVYFAAASSGVPHEYEPRESTPSTQRPLRNAILTHTCTRAGRPGWFRAPSSAVRNHAVPHPRAKRVLESERVSAERARFLAMPYPNRRVPPYPPLPSVRTVRRRGRARESGTRSTRVGPSAGGRHHRVENVTYDAAVHCVGRPHHAARRLARFVVALWPAAPPRPPAHLRRYS